MQILTCKKIKQLAYHDALTSLANRHFFNQLAPLVLARAKRKNFQFAVIMIDVDDFKAINDQFGHQAGDACLQKLAQGFKSTLRESDVLARIGGDEFVLIADELRDEFDIELIINRLVNSIDQSLTVSIGVAIYPQDGKTMDELMSYADKMLYQKKRQLVPQLSG